MASVSEKVFAVPYIMLNNKKRNDRDPDKDSRLFESKYMNF